MSDVTFQVTVNELEADTIHRIIEMRPYYADIVVLKDGRKYVFQGDFVYRVVERIDTKVQYNIVPTR